MPRPEPPRSTHSGKQPAHQSATAAQHGFERGGRIEDSIDGAGLKSLIGLATFGDIHSGDLLDQTGEIAASQLTMDDGPYHASLPLRIRERQAWCRSSIWLFGNALRQKPLCHTVDTLLRKAAIRRAKWV